MSLNSSCSLDKQYFLAASGPDSDSERLRLGSGCWDEEDCLRLDGTLGPGDAEIVRVRVLTDTTLVRRACFAGLLRLVSSSVSGSDP